MSESQKRDEIVLESPPPSPLAPGQSYRRNSTSVDRGDRRPDCSAMNADQVEQFITDGFVRLPGAVPRDVADACASLLWREIGLDPLDRSGWTDPVRWVGGMQQPPFIAAMNCPAVLDACDRFAGPGRWIPRQSMGSFPLRFPHADEPDGLGWHIEASYLPKGASDWHANVHSKERALLALFLFTEVTDADGPTRIRVGSHLDVPAVLAPYGEQGAAVVDCAAAIEAASDHRPTAVATGDAGDVFICHPFLVHAAQANHGTRPRFIGQPAVPSRQPYRWDQPDVECSPVELTIKRALGG